jgi:hypothetical protein
MTGSTPHFGITMIDLGVMWGLLKNAWGWVGIHVFMAHGTWVVFKVLSAGKDVELGLGRNHYRCQHQCASKHGDDNVLYASHLASSFMGGYS